MDSESSLTTELKQIWLFGPMPPPLKPCAVSGSAGGLTWRPKDAIAAKKEAAEKGGEKEIKGSANVSQGTLFPYNSILMNDE